MEGAPTSADIISQPSAAQSLDEFIGLNLPPVPLLVQNI